MGWDRLTWVEIGWHGLTWVEIGWDCLRWVEMGWDWWDGLRWVKMGWDGLRRVKMCLDGLRLGEMGWDGFSWVEMGWDVLICVEIGWDGVIWFKWVEMGWYEFILVPSYLYWVHGIYIGAIALSVAGGPQTESPLYISEALAVLQRPYSCFKVHGCVSEAYLFRTKYYLCKNIWRKKRALAFQTAVVE